VLRRAILATAAFAVVSACADEGPPPEPVSVEAVTATTLPSAVVGAVVGAPLQFRVLSSSGKAIRGVPVEVTVTSGGGTVARAVTKTRSGATSVGAWTLGTAAGPQTLSVRVRPFAPIVFTVNATPAAASAIQASALTAPRAPANTPIPDTLRVRLIDAFGNGVPNVTVNWAVAAGGGSLSGPTSSTDVSGFATAPAWTIGATGAQRLTATAGTLSAEFTATVQSPAASLTLETAPPSTAFAGLALPTPPRFVVRDAGGMTLNSIPVMVTVTAGGGALTNAPTTSTSTPTSVGTWTLGNPLGAQTVTVSVAGIPSLVITTSAVVGPAALLDVVEGAGQSALAGASPELPIRVRVRDIAQHAVQGTTVSWEVIAGGGGLAQVTSTTDPNGIATMPSWTIGKLGGAQSVRATSGSGNLNIGVSTKSDFGLEVRWAGTPPGGAVEQAFSNAVNRIRAIIVGAVSPISVSGFSANSCSPGVMLTETINGLVIFATVEFIDGPGSVLGSAGPCFIRNTDNLTFLGRMRFDSADLDNMVSNGTLESVILHEMLHVIGVGTLWATKGLRLGLAPTTTPFFTGPLAKIACVNEHAGAAVCGAAVPIEDCLNLTGSCGAGTINSHWKESVFRTELMTGFISQTGNPFSRMTIQSLADMGYLVNTGAEDPYSVPAPALMSSIPAFSIQMPEPHGPLAEVDQFGRVTRRFMTRLPPLNH